MRRIVAIAAMATFLASVAADAAPRTRWQVERSPDVLQTQQVKKPSARVATPLVLAPGVVSATAAPTEEDVGDPDSFGRSVTYLGLAQTLPVTLADDCSGSDPTFERCIVNQPAPSPTSFNEADLATMKLPAKASKSLLCFNFTPFIGVSWANNTGSPQTAQFSALGRITIDNEVLDDPALIDPSSGLPFGGSLKVTLSTWHNFHSIQPGEFEDESSSQTRACIAGLVSKRALVNAYGLSETQATQFFKKPMTIHFGSSGTVQMSQFTQYFYGVRVFGD